MRLFDSTAFFINLLTATFRGIVAFMVMMILLLFAVANIMQILNLRNELDESSPREAFSEELPNDFLNAIIYSWKLCLGEFDTDGFEGSN